MHIRRTRPAHSLALPVAILALFCALIAGCGGDDDPNGTGTASVTVLIIAVVGMVVVVMWIFANRRRPPSG